VNTIKCAFYVSGKATRLKKILEDYEAKFILDDLKIVISDSQLDSRMINVLRNFKVDYLFFDLFAAKAQNLDANLELSNFINSYCKSRDIDIIYCFGSHILKGNLIDNYEHKIINFHPSLLPNHKGLYAIDKALDNNDFLIGNSAHIIDEGLDTGPILMQSVVHIDNFKKYGYERILDDQITLLKKIHNALINGDLLLKESRFLRNFNSENTGYFPNYTNEKNQTYFKSNQGILDFRESDYHPMVMRYSELFNEAIINANIEDGRTQPGFPINKFSPFYIASKVAINSNYELSKVKNILKLFYITFTHIDAAEYFGLSNNTLLSNKPPWASVFPWRARTVESYAYQYEKAAIDENRTNGLEEGISSGWLFSGPVSSKKIEVEAKRMVYVTKQILNKGYKRSFEPDGDVKATVLIKEDAQWRWLITSGNHRANAASALGYQTIPIRVNLIISRSDYKYWPGVVNGIYTEVDALRIFDAIFEGKPLSKCAEDWINKVYELNIRNNVINDLKI